MDTGSPKKNTIPVRPILLIVLGAAVAIWFISQRNDSTGRPAPRTSSSNSIANSVSSNTASNSSLPEDQNERVEKYPLLDSPDSEPPDQEFPIQVSLTEQQNPDVNIKNGNVTPEGKLVFALPATQQDSWKLDVVLSAPGMIFTRGGTGISSIELPRHGDATSAIFFVKAGPKAVANGVVHVLATFVYKDTYLARIGRDIQITGGATPELTSLPAASRQTVKVGGAISNEPLSNQVPAPDMTLFIKGDAVQIYSPTFGLTTGTLKDMTGFSNWVAQHSPASAGRGSELIAAEPTQQRAEGFGELLYDNYAPDAFKKVFWALDRVRGKNFRTIQIYSDKPDIPWELMRPVREDGTGRRNFLGLDYSVARWDTNDGVLMERPPYSETMTKMFVIAPHYSGSRSLDGEAKETQELAQLNGYNAVEGNTHALKALFQKPPQGIVHFAGHGELDEAHDEFEILLEDGALNSTAWRSMAQSDPLGHTFFFFNACDVGQAKRTGNFVDGFGPAVLSKGASGYIGALWPVNDRVAAEFAVEFYQLLQQEMQVGPADVSETLERTRREVYEKTKNPTALAYVLYGDTNLKFVR